MKAKTRNRDEENQVNEGKRRIMWEGVGYEQRLFRVRFPIQSNSISTELTCSVLRVSQLCKMCWSEVKNNNRRTEKEGSWSPCSSCVRGVLQSREKQQYLSLIHTTSLAVAVVQMHSSWKSVSVVLERHKVPLSVKWKNWIPENSAATNASGGFKG